LIPKSLLLALACGATLMMSQPSGAQPGAPVYESHDKAGPVFSDEATPGATRVELQPPNVIEAPVPVVPAPAPMQQAPSYQSLAVLSPADGSTIHTNTGDFQVTIRSLPALRASAHDRFKLKFDGRVLPHDYRTTSIHVSPADWRYAAAESTLHTLQLAIVDAKGRVLIESVPVTFYAHRATVHHR